MVIGLSLDINSTYPSGTDLATTSVQCAAVRSDAILHDGRLTQQRKFRRDDPGGDVGCRLGAKPTMSLTGLVGYWATRNAGLSTAPQWQADGKGVRLDAV